MLPYITLPVLALVASHAALTVADFTINIDLDASCKDLKLFYADDATAAKSIVSGDTVPSVIEHGIIWSGEIAQRAGVTLVEMNVGKVDTPNWALSRASGFNAVTTLSLEGESITCDNSGSGDTDGCYRPDGAPDCPIQKGGKAKCQIDYKSATSVSLAYKNCGKQTTKPNELKGARLHKFRK